ncbi:MFS transporter [Pseudohoeflea coraliihabitans]|uniref:MFS transporter n=1 Tax=Pseudohoeflea coraliihabitans TaxID=2860393 RepID=A0ABS6WRW3_9HYPH|nr:MFS transporter [Pseudohoeflea sp. DP4N28-3]MBW3098689.1 MFS transporter [Pseudohoeflea sp. DP4N28-3]
MLSTIAPVGALLLSTFFMLVAAGLSGYLIPLRAVGEGWSTLVISLIATSYAVAFTASCLVTPRLVRRVGHVRVFGVMVTLLSMAQLLNVLVVHPAVWILARGLTGFALAGGYMVIESWLNEKVTNESRGALFSVYMMLSMGGLTVGQYAVPFGDPMLPGLFILAALIFSLAILPTSLSSAQSPQPLTEVRLDLPHLFRRSPAAVVGAFSTGLIGGVWNGLAPVYGTQTGLSTTEGATMLALAMIGGAVFQYPLGRASDRMDRRRVMVVAGAIGVFSCLLIIVLGTSSRTIFFAGMFLLGTVLFPIYALNVAHANDHAEADEFVAVSSGLTVVYGGGAMAGPLIAGTVMDLSGPSGFFVIIGLFFAFYGAYAAWRMTRREELPDEARGEFQATLPGQITTQQALELDPRADPDYGSDDSEVAESESQAG